MAASVRIEELAFGDPRFEVLGLLLGTSKFDALGRMAYLWRWCTERNTHEIALRIAAVYFDGKTDRACHVVAAELADWSEHPCTLDHEHNDVACAHLRLRGTEGRIEWLDEKRASQLRAAAAGGAARVRLAERDAKGRLLSSSRSSRPPAKPSGRVQQNPAAPAPSPAPSPALLTSPDLDLPPGDLPLSPDPPSRGSVLPNGHLELVATSPAAPEGKVSGSRNGAGKGVNGHARREVVEATAKVIAAFNRTFERNLTARGWELDVAKLLAKGYTEAQMRGVVWWAAREWGEDPERRRQVTPKTLLKLQSPQGYRTFPQYLSCAGERWREEHNGDQPPWEQPELNLGGAS